jgi:NAD(P)-dependent dehydrogenase (short-subunit alcohol dehydrogenase family)
MLPPIPQASFDPNAQYILAGGLGGLGRSILQWMVDRGAKNLTVLSRSTTRNPEASLMIDELAGRNISVEVTSCNVTVKEDVENAIRIAGRDRPIKGILHAAAVLLDRLFDNLPHAQWKSGLAAKVQGTINLHQASLEHELPLDFFVMASSFEAVVAMPTQAAYCAANSFQDAFARYRKARGLPACSIAFGLITEIGEFGQRAITRNMIQRHGLYPTGELDFLRLLEAAFLDPTERNFSGHACDPLTKSQITTCLDPYKLAGMSQAGDRNSPEAPRWYADKKFSHLLQAIEDHLGPVEQPQGMKAAKSTVTINVDVAIDAGNIEEASRIVTCAIMERTAALLVIAPESVEAENSVAHYGVDSLIAVELRSWLVLLFESSIPLLKLLDERTSMREVGAWITAERQKRKSHGLE